jgi:hypothetical protein
MIKSALVFNNKEETVLYFYSKIGTISELFGHEPDGKLTINPQSETNTKQELKYILDFCQEHSHVPLLLFMVIKGRWQFISADYAIEPSDVDL